MLVVLSAFWISNINLGNNGHNGNALEYIRNILTFTYLKKLNPDGFKNICGNYNCTIHKVSWALFNDAARWRPLLVACMYCFIHKVLYLIRTPEGKLFLSQIQICKMCCNRSCTLRISLNFAAFYFQILGRQYKFKKLPFSAFEMVTFHFPLWNFGISSLRKRDSRLHLWTDITWFSM